MMPLEGRGFESHPLRQRGARAAKFAPHSKWGVNYSPRSIQYLNRNTYTVQSLRALNYFGGCRLFL